MADLPHLLHHRRSMYEAMGHTGQAMLDEVERISEIYFRAALPSGRYRAWVAETEAGRVVGGGGVVLADWPANPRSTMPMRAWILNIYVEPEFRRRGIARKLMDTLAEWCKSEGFCNVSLHASDEGRPLYESMGFRPTNEMRLEL